MILDSQVIGPNLRLRTAEPTDAEFILSLRLDPELGKYLKPTDPSVENQRKWIDSKKTEIDDYHMIIESHDGLRHGVVAIYDIVNGKFTWGRWIISKEAPIFVAFESMVLMYLLAFKVIGLDKSEHPVRKGNDRVIKMHDAYGCDRIGEDSKFIYFRYTKESFLSNKRFSNFIKLNPGD